MFKVMVFKQGTYHTSVYSGDGVGGGDNGSLKTGCHPGVFF